MSQRAQLLEAVRNNPSNVRFADACRIAGWLGFIHKGGKAAIAPTNGPGSPSASTSRIEMAKSPYTKPSKLLAMIEKYEGHA
jgi:hypothetical protein